MIFIYRLDLYSLEIYCLCKYEHPVSRLSKVIVWQTDQQTRPKLCTMPLRGWSKNRERKKYRRRVSEISINHSSGSVKQSLVWMICGRGEWRMMNYEDGETVNRCGCAKWRELNLRSVAKWIRRLIPEIVSNVSTAFSKYNWLIVLHFFAFTLEEFWTCDVQIIVDSSK